MALIPNVVFYILIFLSVYVQVFFLITFLENRKKIIVRNGKMKLSNYPAVTIVVPCWNEEKTVYQTVRSLLDLNYPKDKVKIFLVDDGSTDSTWNIIRKFEKYPNIKIFRKENGGKYTALNLGLEHFKTDFFGGLDADSFVDSESLIRIMSYFEKDPSVMAVAPSVTVHNPKNFIQNAQKAEYHMSVYLKKMLGFLGAINVTPGPLTIFRKKVFDDLGPYRHGHNTEDMEIAYRMQKNHYKIEHCNDAYVYTNTPTTTKKLYRQRLRWIYGFINNTLDYKSILFRKEYGNFSVFTLPMGIVSILTVSYLFGRIVYNLGDFLYSKILVFKTVGWHFTTQAYNFDSFFLNARSFLFLVILIYFLVIFSMIFGRKMAEGKWRLSLSMIYFFPIFSIIAPFWLMKAVYNTLLKRKPAWR
ncbi:MAG: Glycosyltransferase involved in cell wall bioproteini [Parcubacteria group bacterium Gr01-1014_24]|nr:MAG: Glycosyltransferase involved in cell wall bioproteini [Parcubacteria group bacterium Gr01-1014_24]